MEPCISIITVCYNSEATIEETLQSVIRQQYSNKEFIVIDGQSTDRTMEIVNQYSSDINVVVSERDTGIPDALNKGIARATGDWLYFLSSDDVFYSDTVLREMFSPVPDADLVYGNVQLKSNGERYDGEFDLHKIITRNICHQAQFYRRKIFDSVGLYNDRYQFLSDFDHTLRLFTHPGIKIQYKDIMIAVFNDTGRTSYHVDHAFWKDRKSIFIDRFRDILPTEESARGFEYYFYHSFKTGNVFTGLKVLAQLLFYTRNWHYVPAAFRNFSYRYRTHASV